MQETAASVLKQLQLTGPADEGAGFVWNRDASTSVPETTMSARDASGDGTVTLADTSMFVAFKARPRQHPA